MLALIYIALAGVVVEQGSVTYLTMQIKQPTVVIEKYNTHHKEVVITNGIALIEILRKDK